MSGVPPSSHERSSTDGSESRPDSRPTGETGPATPSEARALGLPSTEPEDLDDLDLSYLLTPSDDPAALGRLAHYEIRRLVGRGGMGRVFQAFDTSLRRTVAVKILASPLAASPMARRRFLREARAAAGLNHPNVVTVHGVGEHRDVPYLVMEYVGGGSLSERVRNEAPLPPNEIIRLGSQIAHGLAAAHALELVHRDIKPANLLLEEGTGRVKITDFGLAQATLDPSESASPAQTAGTPSFMAPELLAGMPATPRSDLFSLGCVLYAMVAGGSPFRGSQLMEVAHRLATETPSPVEQLDPRVPPGLSALVTGLLEKSPDARRPATAAEVAACLDALLADPLSTPQVVPVAPPKRRPSAKRRLRVVLPALLVVVLLGSFAAWRWRRQWSSGRPSVAATGQPGPRSVGERVLLEDGLNWVRALAVSPDGRSALAGGGLDYDVRLWDLTERKVRIRLVGHASWIQSAAFSPDGKYAATGSGGSWKVFDGQRPGGSDFSVHVWSMPSGELVKTFKGHTEPLTGVAFAPDGRTVASSSRDHTVRLWSLEDEKAHRQLLGPAEVFCVAFTPKGDRIMSGSWERATLWDIAERRAVLSFGDHIGPVLSVAVSPDGRKGVTAGDDQTIRVWSLDDGRSLGVLEGHSGRVSAVAWRADGRHLLSGGADGILRLWDVDSGSLVTSFRSPGAPIDCAAFAPSGSRALAGYHDGTARVWDLPKLPDSPHKAARPVPAHEGKGNSTPK